MKYSNRCSILKQANWQNIPWFLKKMPQTFVRCLHRRTDEREDHGNWADIQWKREITMLAFTGLSYLLFFGNVSFHTTLHLNVMSSPWVFGMALLKGSSENPTGFDKLMSCIALGLSRGTRKEAQWAQEVTKHLVTSQYLTCLLEWIIIQASSERLVQPALRELLALGCPGQRGPQSQCCGQSCL